MKYQEKYPMQEFGREDPVWVDRILDWRWTWLLARTAMVVIFLVSAILKSLDFHAAVLEQEEMGLHPGAFWAGLTIAVQGIGCLLVISGRFVWLGAGALGVFTAIAAVMAHGFWTLEGQERFVAMNVFLEHMGLIGGLVMTALVAEHAKREGRP
ncbi:DoxX family protein [Pseudomonas sp. MT3]